MFSLKFLSTNFYLFLFNIFVSNARVMTALISFNLYVLKSDYLENRKKKDI